MNYDFYDDMSIIDGYIPFNDTNRLDLFEPYEGYLKGNAFINQYVPYKNYQIPKLKIRNEKDEMLINIGQYSFMMHEMNLLLDVQPDNQTALNRFNEYRQKTNELITKYERKYGPLAVKGSINDKTPFTWNNMWPWVN